MCGIVDDIKDVGRSIDRGVRSVGREIDDGLHSVGRVIDRGTHAALGTMAGMMFPGLGQGIADSLGYDNQWFGKGMDLGTGIDMAAAAYFGGSQLFQGLGAMSGGVGEGVGGYLNGMGGFGGMTGAGVPSAGSGWAAGGGGGLGGLLQGAQGLFGGSGGGLFDIGRGLFGLYNSNQLRQAGEQPESAKLAERQLLELMRDPSKVTSMPGYEAGMEAVQRGMASQGYLGSGNMATALQKYGGDFYTNAVNQLKGIAYSGREQAYQGTRDSISLAGQSLGSLGYGAARTDWGSMFNNAKNFFGG